jgi:hypothetical protein
VAEDLVPDRRTRLEAKLSDLHLALFEARTTDVRQMINESIAMIEEQLAALPGVADPHRAALVEKEGATSA